MVEIYQTNITHSSASARSRLDRFYANQHKVEQLDRKMASVAFHWVRKLSNKRAILFSSSRPNDFPEDMRPIQLNIIKHANFPRRVALHVYEAIKNQSDASGIWKLVLLKESMREVFRHPFTP